MQIAVGAKKAFAGHEEANTAVYVAGRLPKIRLVLRILMLLCLGAKYDHQCASRFVRDSI